jgi:hypothetical protein
VWSLRPGLAIRFFLLAASGCATLATLYVAACIPDLPPDGLAAAADGSTPDAIPDEGAATEGGSPDSASASHCGNGMIELELNEQCDPGGALGDAGTAFCSPSCQMLCPDGGFLWSSNDHCYTLAGESPSLPEAGTLCSPGHVVTFASDDEFEAVTGALGSSDDGGPYSFWVGMRAHLLGDNHYDAVVVPRYEPGWSPDCSGCYARATGDGGDFAHNDAGNGGDCVRSRASPSVPYWEKSACLGAPKMRVICEHEPEEARLLPATTGLFYFDLVSTYGKKSYVYDDLMPVTEANAEATCVSHGGTLVILQSRDEREQLWKQLSQTSATRVWIGLATSDAGWAWDDEAGADPDASPSAWAIGEPSPLGPAADGGSRRAYLALTDQHPVDTTLARTEPLGPPNPGVVCELPPLP